MKPLLRNLACLVLALGLAPALHAADALERAIAHATALQTQALGAVAAAERAYTEAQADLRVNRGIEAEARRSRDPAAMAVAGEAVQQAQALERETARNLALARALLDARTRQQASLRELSQWRRPPRAVLVSDEGQVQRYNADGSPVRHGLAVLSAGERIETGPGGGARLFVSGGDAEVALGGNSSYSVTQDDVQGDFMGQLDAGLMRMRALVRQKLGKKFEVRTPSAVTSVRGTDFSVARTPAGDRVQVYSGVVAVAPVAGGAEVLVQAGQFLVVPPTGAWPAPLPLQPGADELPWEGGR